MNAKQQEIDLFDLYQKTKDLAERAKSFCDQIENQLDPNRRLAQGKLSAYCAVLQDLQDMLGIIEELPYEVDSVLVQTAK